MAGRPRSFDRDQALDVAVQQFWRLGYDATTVAGLCGAMGIGAPSLYAAFGDKEQLFAAAVAQYDGRMLSALDADLSAPDLREALATMLTHTAAAHTEAASPLGCFVLTEPRLEAQREEVRRRIAERIAAAGERLDADGLSRLLLAILVGMSSAARDGADATAVRGIADAALAGLGSELTPAQALPGTTSPLS